MRDLKLHFERSKILEQILSREAEEPRDWVYLLRNGALRMLVENGL